MAERHAPREARAAAAAKAPELKPPHTPDDGHDHGGHEKHGHEDDHGHGDHGHGAKVMTASEKAKAIAVGIPMAAGYGLAKGVEKGSDILDKALEGAQEKSDEMFWDGLEEVPVVGWVAKQLKKALGGKGGGGGHGKKEKKGGHGGGGHGGGHH